MGCGGSTPSKPAQENQRAQTNYQHQQNTQTSVQNNTPRPQQQQQQQQQPHQQAPQGQQVTTQHPQATNAASQAFSAPIEYTRDGSHKQQSSNRVSDRRIGQLFVAQFDYAGASGDLSLKSGEILEILDTSEGDWWKARSVRTELVGYVPSNFLYPKTDFANEPWFHSNVERADAERMLVQVGQRGAFLVRESRTRPGSYSLSVLDHDTIVKHYQIKVAEDPPGAVPGSSGFYISKKSVFLSLRDLIHSYHDHQEGLCAVLTVPCPKAGPTLTDFSHATRDMWEIKRETIGLSEKLGEGEFGTVWKGTWNNNTHVAVKELKKGNMGAEEFLKEASIMKKLQHQNLVRLYAVCTDSEPYYIVLEYMGNGSLRSFLLRNQQECSTNHQFPDAADISYSGNSRYECLQKCLTWRQRADMCQQVASGMAFLESKNMIHRDLAARNVLLNLENVCKVADFGLARDFKNSSNNKGEEPIYTAHADTKFPVKWTAPEAIIKGAFSVKSDVWSFGILMMEIATGGAIPYPGMGNMQVVNLLNDNYRQPKPPRCPDEYYEVIQNCLRQFPEERPTFESLQWVMEDLFGNARLDYEDPSTAGSLIQQ
ncbi:TK/SFK-SRC protein kinase [Sphaeroforma arctica JP610]|uniref:non-specific protein-tyrosine kinase n=1 Tax=Sphaeroforma arctica JP610 TaxID=667725 RepID=A0A0L0FEP2_9EUKA|nr:TK/SFK-SRC protein kinase [Sphaeroforma arctica JP610]KNC74523.1 TK/SFK-SRC protein kinase [Sphaeroforma arctica JP610]|eukprot:XP_014148425.1 TK/SFK-SRC protein kinase [Sphaeroforma arctica JP610]